MTVLLQENWWLLVIALLIGVLVAWWVLVASRKTTVEREEKPEEDAAAKRNQALIDAPPVAATTPPEPEVSTPLTAVPEAAKLVEEEAAPAPAPAPVPTPAPTPAPAPATASAADDLSRIKGVGPKLVTMLREQGITSFAQIAVWDDATIDRIDAGLGRFQGRIRRDNWTEQAKLLAADDIAGYEGRFGKV